MHSIQAKLGSGLLLSLIITFSALWLLVSFNAQSLSEDYIASRLQHDAESLLSNIKFDQDNQIQIDMSRAGLIYTQPFSGHYFVITHLDEKIYSRSLWDYQLIHNQTATGQTQRSRQLGPDNQSLLIVSNGYLKHGIPLTISVAEDLNPIKQNIDAFKYWFAFIAVSFLVLLLSIQIFILRNSLRPIRMIQNEIKSLEQGELDKLSTNSPNELRPLIHEINHLLDVLKHHQHRSRNALSDLAHALKKPLTVIQQIIDHETMKPNVHQLLQKQTDEIYSLTDRILKKARLSGHKHGGTFFSFSEDLPDLIQTLNAMHVSKKIKLSMAIKESMLCPIDREDMLELLGNLLDNAYKWAEKNIRISAQIKKNKLHILIEDDGPGANMDKIQHLSTRGVRLDEKTQGHGFGLAIVYDMVSEYQGKIDFHKSHDLGGFKVDIYFPLDTESML